MGKHKNPDNDYRFGYRRLIKVMRLNGHNDIHKFGLKKPKIVQMFALKFNRTYPLKNGILAFIKMEFNDPTSPMFRDLRLPAIPLNQQNHKRKNKAAKKCGEIKRPKLNKFRQKYLDYLDSKEWKDLRNSIKAERGNKCEVCGIDGGKGVILDGHHLTYVRLFNELTTDIQIVCRPCHKNIHGH